MLTDVELNIRIEGLQQILELEKLAVLDLKQKSRIKWIVEGDKNSEFSYGHINSKHRRNTFHGLMVNGKWVSSLEEVKYEALRFFKGKFIESLISRPKLISPYLKSISMMEAIKLEAPFTLDEIKYAVWARGSDKPLGHDGLIYF